MKRFHKEWQTSRLGRMYRHLCSALRKSDRITLREDMEMGAVTGFFACSALTLYFAGDDLSAAMLILFSGLGICLGAVIGAVLWIGAARLPEDTVLSPGPGQGRSDNPRRPPPGRR